MRKETQNVYFDTQNHKKPVQYGFSGLNGTGFEEAIFLERVLGIIAGHDPDTPLFLYYPMHLVTLLTPTQ